MSYYFACAIYRCRFFLNDRRLILTYNKLTCFGAVLAQWIRPHLPSRGPGFESQEHYLCFFLLESTILPMYVIVLKRTKINKKRPGLALFRALKLFSLGQG